MDAADRDTFGLGKSVQVASLRYTLVERMTVQDTLVDYTAVGHSLVGHASMGHTCREEEDDKTFRFLTAQD